MECPIMMNAKQDVDKQCQRYNCAWWIPKEHCCAVIAIYRRVTEGSGYDIVAKSDTEAG